MGQGDALLPGLFAGVEIAFEHQAHDGLATVAELAEDFAGHDTLTPVIFAGVVVRAVDHNWANDAFAGHRGFRARNMLGVVVCFSASATQHDMPIGIAHRSDDRRLAFGVDPDKMVRSSRSGHRIDGDLKAPFRSILEAHRHREAAGHLAMCLAFGRSGADRGPADEVGDILWADGVEQFGAAGHAGLIDLQ